MSFSESTFELIIVQKEKKTRANANAFISKSKKRRFIVLKQKQTIQTFEVDYTFFITFIYRSFQLHHVYMTSWKFVQMFLFFLQSIFDLLFHHINQKIHIIETNWNALIMMKLHQWIAIRIFMIQNLTKMQQFNQFDFVRIFTIYHSIAIDIKSLNVIWMLNWINEYHTTMHHDFEKSKTFWTFSEFDSFRLLFVKVILQSTSLQSNFTIVWKTTFV